MKVCQEQLSSLFHLAIFFLKFNERNVLKCAFRFLLTGWSGTQAYLFAVGGVQYRPGPALHQKIDRHANLNHDQGHCPFSP